MENLIIVFTKNPTLGKVKTRLAKTIGDEKALEIFKLLMTHTLQVTSNATADKYVFYSDYIPENDVWKSKKFFQFLQNGNELGEKMSHAFSKSFENGYKQVVIVGSDCLDLTTELIHEAFENLKTNDVVAGPALDGGYYLLGMNAFYPTLFENKTWSTETVLKETLDDVIKMSKSYTLLKALSDIDEEKDLQNYPQLLQV